MLKISKKEYEIEEQIQLTNEEGNILYEFDMKLKDFELKELQNVLLGKETLKLAKKIKDFEGKVLTEEETTEVLQMSEDMSKNATETISRLCFKEHKDKFIELSGEIKFEEMVEVISDYLLGFFIKKQTNKINTINSDLTKISMK
jgi:hypothetical protein